MIKIVHILDISSIQYIQCETIKKKRNTKFLYLKIFFYGTNIFIC